MSPGGRAWCRVLMGLLLVAAGAAVELYDDFPPTEDLVYQDDNDIDTGPPNSDKKLFPILAKDILLYRMLRALQHEESLKHSPAFRPMDMRDDDENRSENLGVFKAGVYKRLSEVYGGIKPGYKGAGSDTKLPKKWKIKKGKTIGSQMVCYFKLCAFRSP